MKIKLKKITSTVFLALIASACFQTYSFSDENKTKILLIGIDGGSWNVIGPLVKEGRLPNIKKIIDDGSSGGLESFDPLVSEVIWTSIATGKSPEKHKISQNLIEDPFTGEFIPVTRNQRSSKAIWNILSEHEKKVGVIGYMCTWPPEKINGVMISDRADHVTEYSSRGYSFPSFDALCDKRDFDSFKAVENSVFSRIEKNKFTRWYMGLEEADMFKVNFSKYLLKKEDFDFFCFYIRGIDALSHVFWEYMAPKLRDPPKKDMGRYKDIIRDYYIRCDEIIGDFLKLADEDTVIIICSDHGFSSIDYVDALPLELSGILTLSGLTESHKNSKAFSVVDKKWDYWRGAVRCLQITGDLSPKELVEEVKKEAKDALEDIKIKETGQQVFEIGKDIEDGFMVIINEKAIYERVANTILIKGKEYKVSEFLAPDIYSGRHDKSGIVFMYGKNIRHNKIIEDANIYDIAPTILYIMGFPLGVDMKGKPILEAIDEEFLREQPVRYVTTYEADKKEEEKQPDRSPSDEKKIKELMRSLGYIN